MNKHVVRAVLACLYSVAIAGCMEMDIEAGDAEESALDVGTATSAIEGCPGWIWHQDLTVEDEEGYELFLQLSEVRGSLRFESTSYTTVTGSPCLEAIGGNLIFEGNASLTRIGGFDRLDSIGGTLGFPYNGRSLEIAGFAELDSIGGNLTLYGGSITIQGFDELERIGGRIIGADIGSVSILGMRDLSTVGGMTFVNGGTIVLDGLTDLERVLGTIEFNELGTVFTAGLTDLSTITGSLVFIDVAVDEVALAGFRDLKYVDGNLSLSMISRLRQLDAFQRLRTIGGSLSIGESSITSITGFRTLESIGGSLVIKSNEGLQTITGLGLLASVGRGVGITDNASLPTCTAQGLADRLVAGGFAGTVTIAGNALDACAGSPVAAQPAWLERAHGVGLAGN